mmetsp:Transcript_9548/g.19526  ORF Transcript_9548/g.19526 Transcript_9548/m.19526 type:complete len:220 (-) Transcript_9548:386-1045(-)
MQQTTQYSYTMQQWVVGLHVSHENIRELVDGEQHPLRVPDFCTSSVTHTNPRSSATLSSLAAVLQQGMDLRFLLLRVGGILSTTPSRFDCDAQALLVRPFSVNDHNKQKSTAVKPITAPHQVLRSILTDPRIPTTSPNRPFVASTNLIRIPKRKRKSRYYTKPCSAFNFPRKAPLPHEPSNSEIDHVLRSGVPHQGLGLSETIDPSPGLERPDCGSGVQ